MLENLRKRIEDYRESNNLFWKFLYLAKDSVYKITVKIGLRKSNCWAIKLVAGKCKKIPDVFVETGTYRGFGARTVLRDFKTIHTIELSEKWYKNAVNMFRGYKNVFCHYGDSAEILTKILPNIKKPVLFYLDAHYSGGTTAFGADEVPLLRELKIIGKRNYNDIILIDDLNLMGKSGIGGEEGHKYYPPVEFDWRDITKENIKQALGKKCFNWEERDNRIIIWGLEDKIEN